MSRKIEPKPVSQAPVIDDYGCFDELVIDMIKLTMSHLSLTGHDLSAATELVIGIMKNAGKHQKAYYRYAVLCGAYPNGVVVDGVTYDLQLAEKAPGEINCRRQMLMALQQTMPAGEVAA
ncbi:hypothetical protein RPD76_07670 [Methylomonas sp. MV1]|uniref:hypothetical protein n=1 Tax=Methylomonas sp. MV1 TaxID=3073620 RepID=UPI0028A48660|nr:hypothetical protein [Methylomonas sp. MV1]MDT4329784.1 hypothetical protein [Methylomonas sp. MV1]